MDRSASLSPATMATRVSKHVPALDGVRGLAILMVMAYHFYHGSHHIPLLNAPYVMSRAGWVGVDLFFVLSGFLITGILLDTKGRANYFKNFYARRTLRIFPLYYGVLIVVFAIAAAAPALREGSFASIWHNQFFLWAYLVNWKNFLSGDLVFVSEWFEANHFWSLAVEEQFYLVWPLLILLIPRKAIPAFCIVLLGLAYAARLAGAVYAFPVPLFRADSLVLGALLAWLARHEAGRAVLARAAIPTLVVSGCVLLAVALVRGGFSSHDTVVLSAGVTVLSVFFGALLIVAFGSPDGSWVHRAMSLRLLTSLGKYSYGIYVFHWALNPLVQAYVVRPEWIVQLTPVTLVNNMIDFLLRSLISFAIAWSSYHLYEKHFLNLKRFFSSREPAGSAIPKREAVTAAPHTL